MLASGRGSGGVLGSRLMLVIDFGWLLIFGGLVIDTWILSFKRIRLMEDGSFLL